MAKNSWLYVLLMCVAASMNREVGYDTPTFQPLTLIFVGAPVEISCPEIGKSKDNLNGP